MPTLELLLLQLHPGISPTSPALLSVLSAVRNFVQTNSRFYTSLEDNSHLYILGEWPSLDAHKDFLASPEREAVLKPQDQLADFVWCEHYGTKGSMGSVIPLEADVLVLDRRWVKHDEKAGEGFERVVRRYREEVVMGSVGVVFDGWRTDQREVEGEGAREYVMVSGWESKNQHLELRETAQRDVPEFAGVGRYYDVSKGDQGVEVVHLRDVERIVAKGGNIR
jgi:heme-degrading monooxygenase HmoA